MVDRKTIQDKIIPKWQITATTVYCDIVEHEAKISVNKDWNVACAYHKRWVPIRRQKKKGVSKVLAWLGIGSDERHLVSNCQGPEECPYIRDYRDKLYQEELGG